MRPLYNDDVFLSNRKKGIDTLVNIIYLVSMIKRDGYKTKLANAVGVTVQQISMLIDGKTNATIGTAKKIQRALTGGGILVWMDPDQALRRVVIFNRYKEMIR